MFKFQLGDKIWYIMDNVVCSAPVLARKLVDTAYPDVAKTIPPSFSDWNDQHKLFTPFGKPCEWYATCHGRVSADKAFATRADLVAYMMGETK